MYMISRILKPIAVALIMFLSLHYLGLSVVHSMFMCLIPLALGWLNILTELGYLLAAICMIAAIGWAVVPTGIKSAVSQNIQVVIDDFNNRDAATPTEGT